MRLETIEGNDLGVVEHANHARSSRSVPIHDLREVGERLVMGKGTREVCHGRCVPTRDAAEGQCGIALEDRCDGRDGRNIPVFEAGKRGELGARSRLEEHLLETRGRRRNPQLARVDIGKLEVIGKPTCGVLQGEAISRRDLGAYGPDVEVGPGEPGLLSCGLGNDLVLVVVARAVQVEHLGIAMVFPPRLEV